MDERGNLASVLRVLKTTEARAALLYDSFKAREIVDAIPPGLEDGARCAVGIAFETKDYRTGFVIAEQAGILEEILATIDKAPERIGPNEQIPESVKAIPGYSGEDRDSGEMAF